MEMNPIAAPWSLICIIANNFSFCKRYDWGYLKRHRLKCLTACRVVAKFRMLTKVIIGSFLAVFVGFCKGVEKMQLDVDVSPPVISLLVDINPNCWILGQFLRDRRTVINFFLVLEFFSSDFWSSPRQTDRQKATPKSPPCMSTSGLKNHGKTGKTVLEKIGFGRVFST